MGDLEARTSVFVESSLGYHPSYAGALTVCCNPGTGHCQVGSLTGAVASQKVTEAPNGSLRMVGNHSVECKSRRELDCERDISSRYESRV